MEKWETLTTDQMSRANTIVQRLVKDCVEEIHAILHEEKNNENKPDGE